MREKDQLNEQLVTGKEKLGQKLCDEQAKLLEEMRLKDEATRQNTELEKTISSLVGIPEMLKEDRSSDQASYRRAKQASRRNPRKIYGDHSTTQDDTAAEPFVPVTRWQFRSCD